MAVRLLNGEIFDLCLGKPELPWISASASISDALARLKASGDTQVSVWACGGDSVSGSCVCVGKFSVADVILYLCREDNLADPFKALEAPVSDILPKTEFPVVRHLEPNSSLLEAIEYMLEGTQNLVIPIKNHRTTNRRKNFPIRQPASNCNRLSRLPHCQLTQEDVLRYLLNSIGAFSPIPSFTIGSLDVIDQDIITVPYDKPASSALHQLSRAFSEQKPVAVVDEENRLIGEISPAALSCCDVSASAAVMALSAGDLMAYIEYTDPPEDMVQVVKMRLEESNLAGMVELMDEFFHSSAASSLSSCFSSDDELASSGNGPSSRNGSWGRHYPLGRGSEMVVCRPGSSLVAVMIQALANRAPCVWVVEDDQTLVGTVTLAGIVKVLRNAAPALT